MADRPPRRSVTARALAMAVGMALGVALVDRPAAANPASGEPSLPISRSEALRLGATRSHGVMAAGAGQAVLPELERAAAAPLAYAPRLGVYAGGRQGAFGTGVEVGASATQDLSLHGLGSARVAVHESTRAASLAAIERARLEGAALAVLAWIDLVEAQELVRLRRRVREDAEAFARLARARVQRGVGMPLEEALAQAEVGAAELGERDAEGRLAVARAQLCFALALPPTTPVSAEGHTDPADDPPAIPPPATPHPELAAAQSQVAASRSEATLVRAQSSPALGVGVSYARDGTGEQALTGTLSFPLPFLDPTRFERARQHIVVRTAEAYEARVRAELARDLALAEHERTHAREVRVTLRRGVVAPLREATRLARAAYEGGTQDLTGLLLARPRLVAAEEQLAHATAEVERADVRYAVAHGTLVARGR